MISNRWIEQRQGLWQRLDALLVQTEQSGLKSLSGDELRELGLLYRQVAQDLSAVRGDRGSRTQEEYLNLLLARAHNRVYSGRKLEARQLVRFFAVEYPRIFRRMFPYVAASVAIFLAGAALGTLLSVARPAFERMILGPAMVASIEKHQMWTHSLVSMKPQASTGIMTNNIGVAFMTFAGGITAGLWTLYELVLQWHGTGRGEHGLRTGAHGSGPVELRRGAWSAGAAEHLHRRGRGPAHRHGHAVSRNLQAPGFAGARLGGSHPAPRRNRAAAGDRRDAGGVSVAVGRTHCGQVPYRRRAVFGPWIVADVGTERARASPAAVP